jgi:Family of unknown function (DUF6510)
MSPTETPGNPNPADPPEPTDTTATADTSNTSEPYNDQRLDGNAAGGILDAIFAFEMTMAVVTCADCGTTNLLGAVMAYIHGMGTILRCPMCDTALIRVAHIRNRYYLDMRGMRMLQISEVAALA